MRVEVVLVRQESSQSPIAADIYRKSDMSNVFVTVGSSGRAEPNKTCSDNDTFVATPKTPAYLQIDPLQCAATLDFKLPSVETTYALVVKANDAEKSGDFAAAQQFYSLAAERFRVSQPAQYAVLQSKAHAAAAQVLKVGKPTAKVGGMETLTPEMQAKLKAVQSSAHIAPSGVLDERTQQVLSKTTSKAAVESARQVPAERVHELMQLQPGQ